MHDLELQTLVSQLAATQKKLDEANETQRQLAADFAFNLTLIAERDNELAAFEAHAADLRQVRVRRCNLRFSSKEHHAMRPFFWKQAPFVDNDPPS